MIHIVMDIFEITFSMFDYLLYVIIIMLIYGIKIIQKMSIFLTAYSSYLLLRYRKKFFPQTPKIDRDSY
jgi:hypothetical protein